MRLLANELVITNDELLRSVFVAHHLSMSGATALVCHTTGPILMMLPPGSLLTLRDGLDALLWAERLLLARLQRRPLDPESLLALRDVRGLRERLEAFPEEQWQAGWTFNDFVGQDLGVLDEWAAECATDSPYRDDALESEKQLRAAQFRALRELLAWYENNWLEFGR